MKEEYCVVFVTTSEEAEAKNITNHIIEERLAACVNRIQGISSTYWWKEKIENSTENLLIIKTRTEKVSELIDTVKKYHSYSVPEIIAMPIIEGNSDYLNWIDEVIE